MSPGALIGPIIIAIGLVAAAIAFAIAGALIESADSATEFRLDAAERELTELRRQVERLEGELKQARSDLESLRERQSALSDRTPPPAGTLPDPEQSLDEVIDDHEETQAPTEIMRIADDKFNRGITQPGNALMIEVLGHPRSSYSSDCQPVTNPRLRDLLETRDYGTFRVTMIRPALESLDRIMARLKQTDPDIHAAIGTAGALCARLIRGSSRSVSNHSWGTAIDIKLGGQLDGFGDGGTQFGLLILAEAFNDEGWFWGATYSREDSMHFEVGGETLREWQAEGQI